jgi:hypothetical protein
MNFQMLINLKLKITAIIVKMKPLVLTISVNAENKKSCSKQLFQTCHQLPITDYRIPITLYILFLFSLAGFR